MTSPNLNGSVVPKYPKQRMSRHALPARAQPNVKPTRLGFYDARRQTGDGGLKSPLPPHPTDRNDELPGRSCWACNSLPRTERDFAFGGGGGWFVSLAGAARHRNWTSGRERSDFLVGWTLVHFPMECNDGDSYSQPPARPEHKGGFLPNVAQEDLTHDASSRLGTERILILHSKTRPSNGRRENRRHKTLNQACDERQQRP
jgi:hypothetical protein